MTLGCGGYGGNITSDNISPRHLLNIKRLAYEMTPAAEPVRASAPRAGRGRRVRPASRADALTRRIDAFLGSRGYRAEARRRASRPCRSRGPRRLGGLCGLGRLCVLVDSPLDFVCEDDVRAALSAGRKLVISERAIVTPAARELGEAAPGLHDRAVARVTSRANSPLLLSQLDLPLTVASRTVRMTQP